MIAERLARKGGRILSKGLAHVIDERRRARASDRLGRLPLEVKLHLGCGPNKLPGWVNVDIDRMSRPDLRHDLRLGLPMRSRTASFIYSEHVFEHLDLHTAQRLLRDCAVALREDGVLRIAMPDLALLVDRYRGQWRDQEWLRDPAYSYIETPAQMLNVALRQWGHRYVYDFEDLHHRLNTSGFSKIVRRAWQDSPHPELRGLETRHDSRLVVEASFG